MSDTLPRDYTLSRKEGWVRMVQARPRTKPDDLGQQELAVLSTKARAEYDAARATWHANLGPLTTPQMTAIHDMLWEIVDSNQQDGDRVKGAVAIDAYPGLGKTTIANAFGRDYHRHVLGLQGERTEAGHERVPVCHVGLTSNTTMRTLNLMLVDFYGHPARRGNAAQLASRALDCILSCETRLVIVDFTDRPEMRTRRPASRPVKAFRTD
jgi:hypothetical protein